MTDPRRMASAALLLFLLLVWGQPAGAQDPYSWMAYEWEQEDATVAVIDGENYTVNELFLWQIIRDSDPEAVRLIESEEGVQAADPEGMREAVESLAIARILTDMPSASQNLSEDLSRKATRIISARAALLLFGDLVVEPNLMVTDYDLANYYQQNLNQYSDTAWVEASMLSFPVTDPLDPSQRDEARKRALEIRRRAVEEGGLNAVSTKDESIGALKKLNIQEGSGKVPRQIEEVLFNLATSQISEPQFLGDSVVLYEIDMHLPEQRIPFVQVRDEIQERLIRRIFMQQMNYRIDQLVKDVRPLNRVEHFAALEKPMQLVQVGDFELSKGEFLRIFPQFEENQRTTPELSSTIENIIRGEAVSQFLEAGDLFTDVRYGHALELSRIHLRAQNAEQVLRQQVWLSDADIESYIEKNQLELAPRVSRYVWKLAAIPERADELGRQRRRLLEADMRSRLNAIIEEAERLLAERAEISGALAYLSPQLVVNRLLGARPDQFALSFSRVGELTPPAASSIGFDMGKTKVGEFSEIMADGSALVSYFSADEEELAQPPAEELRKKARARLIEQAGRGPALAQLRDLREQGKFDWKVKL